MPDRKVDLTERLLAGAGASCQAVRYDRAGATDRQEQTNGSLPEKRSKREIMGGKALTVKTFMERVKPLRSDLSDWVVHFTKGTHQHAEETIGTILAEGALRSFVIPPVICFTEAPLREFNKLFQIFAAYPEPMFAPYGIAVPKTWLFEHGGRPAIYGPPGDLEDLPAGLKYRHVEYNPANYDFAWMREWRIASEVLPLERENTLVILPTDDEAFGLTCDVEVEGEPCGGGEIETIYSIVHDWYSVSLADIAAQQTHQDEITAKSIEMQELRERRESA